MLVEGRVERLLRRFARDRWVRLHGTPRITVLAGARPLLELYRSWVSFAAMPAKLYRDRDVDRAVRDACSHAIARPEDTVAVHTSMTALARWRAGRHDRLDAMVDEGLVCDEREPSERRSSSRRVTQRSVAPRDRRVRTRALPRLDARSAAEWALFEALEATPATAGRFRLNESLSVRFGAAACEVDLLARGDQIAIEVDGYHHFTGRDAYRRDRRKDLLMQQQGLLVIRVLAGDVIADPRPAVRMVLDALASRSVSA